MSSQSFSGKRCRICPWPSPLPVGTRRALGAEAACLATAGLNPTPCTRPGTAHCQQVSHPAKQKCSGALAKCNVNVSFLLLLISNLALDISLNNGTKLLGVFLSSPRARGCPMASHPETHTAAKGHCPRFPLAGPNPSKVSSFSSFPVHDASEHRDGDVEDEASTA